MLESWALSVSPFFVGPSKPHQHMNLKLCNWKLLFGENRVCLGFGWKVCKEVWPQPCPPLHYTFSSVRAHMQCCHATSMHALYHLQDHAELGKERLCILHVESSIPHVSSDRLHVDSRIPLFMCFRLHASLICNATRLMCNIPSAKVEHSCLKAEHMCNSNKH